MPPQNEDKQNGVVIDLRAYVEPLAASFPQCIKDMVARPIGYLINNKQLGRQDFGIKPNEEVPSDAEQIKRLTKLWRERFLGPAGITDEKIQNKCIDYFSKYFHQGGVNSIGTATIPFAMLDARKQGVSAWIEKGQPEAKSNFIIRKNQIIIEQDAPIEKLACGFKQKNGVEDMDIIDVQQQNMRIRSQQILTIDPSTGTIKHELKYCEVTAKNPFVELPNGKVLDIRLAIQPQKFLDEFKKIYEFNIRKIPFLQGDNFEPSDKLSQILTYLQVNNELQQQAELISEGVKPIPDPIKTIIAELPKVGKDLKANYEIIFQQMASNTCSVNNLTEVEKFRKAQEKIIGADIDKAFAELKKDLALKKTEKGIGMFQAFQKTLKSNEQKNKQEKKSDTAQQLIQVVQSLKEKPLRQIIKDINFLLTIESQSQQLGLKFEQPKEMKDLILKLMKACEPIISLHLLSDRKIHNLSKNEEATKQFVHSIWKSLYEVLNKPLGDHLIEQALQQKAEFESPQSKG